MNTNEGYDMACDMKLQTVVFTAPAGSVGFFFSRTGIVQPNGGRRVNCNLSQQISVRNHTRPRAPIRAERGKIWSRKFKYQTDGAIFMAPMEYRFSTEPTKNYATFGPSHSCPPGGQTQVLLDKEQSA